MGCFTQRKGRVGKEVKPLFPNYIFGNFDPVHDYTLVKYGKGVNKIVSFGNTPAPVSELVIGEIKKRIDATGIVKIKFDLKENDPVRVKIRPFPRISSAFLKKWLPERERVRILLNMIGYQPQIELHYSMIEKVA